ncbi:MAG: flagellar protein FlgN [Clostridiaceae bacterium]|nr:flagellar protein FlgN [Clostridiaceae bacterium]
MDKTSLENLIKVLKYEFDIYSAIMDAGIKKTDCLIKNNIQTLVSLTEQEKELSKKAEQLNQAREQLIKKISGGIGQDPGSVTLSELIKQVPQPYSQQLEDIGNRLTKLINELSARNDINKKLIENALQYVDFSIQLMASPQPEAPVYGKSGNEVSNAPKRSVLDIKY